MQGAPWNSLRCCAAAFGQPRRARQQSVCVLRHTHHPASCAPRRIQKGTPKDGPSLRSALNTWPSAAMARVGFTPFWLRRGAQGMADQGSRLFERRRREFERDPASTEHRRLPRRCAPGSQAAGSPSFAFFSWRDKKRRCPAGGTSRPPPSAQAVRPTPRRRAHKNPTKNPSSARVTSATSYKFNSA